MLPSVHERDTALPCRTVGKRTAQLLSCQCTDQSYERAGLSKPAIPTTSLQQDVSLDYPFGGSPNTADLEEVDSPCTRLWGTSATKEHQHHEEQHSEQAGEGQFPPVMPLSGAAGGSSEEPEKEKYALIRWERKEKNLCFPEGNYEENVEHAQGSLGMSRN